MRFIIRGPTGDWVGVIGETRLLRETEQELEERAHAALARHPGATLERVNSRWEPEEEDE